MNYRMQVEGSKTVVNIFDDNGSVLDTKEVANASEGIALRDEAMNAGWKSFKGHGKKGEKAEKTERKAAPAVATERPTPPKTATEKPEPPKSVGAPATSETRREAGLHPAARMGGPGVKRT